MGADTFTIIMVGLVVLITAMTESEVSVTVTIIATILVIVIGKASYIPLDLFSIGVGYMIGRNLRGE